MARQEGSADCASRLTRGAICDMFTILAHSKLPRVGAGRAARHPASRQGGNALVLANTSERSKTVARNKLVAKIATHDAILASSRVRAVKCFELSFWARVLSEHRHKVVVTRQGILPAKRDCCNRDLPLLARRQNYPTMSTQEDDCSFRGRCCRSTHTRTPLHRREAARAAGGDDEDTPCKPGCG